MHFTVDWFAGHERNWVELVGQRLAGRAGLRILEIGCWEGRCSTWMLQNLATAPDASLVCVDPWGSAFEEGSALQQEFEGNRKAWERNVAASGQQHKVRVLHERSCVALPRLISENTVTAPVTDSDHTTTPTTSTIQTTGHPTIRSGTCTCEAQSDSANIRSRDSGMFDLIYVDGSHMRLDVLTDAVMAWQLLRVGGLLVFDDYEWNQYEDNLVCHPRQAVDAFLLVAAHCCQILYKGYQVFLLKTA
ncbi:MAG: hypothetical protein WDW38_011333 [Sanguina aurantia]